MELQPGSIRLEDHQRMQGVVYRYAVNRALLGKGADLVLAGVKARAPSVAIQNADGFTLA
jgi:hypothetical protein